MNNPLNLELQGCDVSHWNGQINWENLRSDGVRFVFMKATQGSSDIDPDFEANWAGAGEASLYRGAYHFYQPGGDPMAQAEHFLSVAKPQSGDLLPVLDIEESGSESPDVLSNNMAIWINHIRGSTGKYPIVYTYTSFWDSAITHDFSACPLWIADWETEGAPNLPNGWQHWAFWQYSSTGRLSGIPDSQGKTDLDYFYGNINDLNQFMVP